MLATDATFSHSAMAHLPIATTHQRLLLHVTWMRWAFARRVRGASQVPFAPPPRRTAASSRRIVGLDPPLAAPEAWSSARQANRRFSGRATVRTVLG